MHRRPTVSEASQPCPAPIQHRIARGKYCASPVSVQIKYQRQMGSPRAVISVSNVVLSMLSVAAMLGCDIARARADHLADGELRRAISGTTIKAKTAKDGNSWEIRFGRTRDAEFKFADGTRRRAEWQVVGKRIEFVFSPSGDRTCRMIYMAPDGKQHWQDCGTAETSSYLTHPIFAKPSNESHANFTNVSSALNVETEALKARQFAQIGLAEIAIVKTNAGLKKSVTLEAKRTYALVAACGDECGHVRLVLRDPDGSTLFESPEKQQVVVVSGVADRAGKHEIQVSVPGCKTDRCPAGFQVMRLEK